MPAEWEKHKGTWLQWPQDGVYRSYGLKLEGMWLAMVDALHQHENVHVIVADEQQRDHVLRAEEGRCGFAHGLSGRWLAPADDARTVPLPPAFEGIILKPLSAQGSGTPQCPKTIRTCSWPLRSVVQPSNTVASPRTRS